MSAGWIEQHFVAPYTTNEQPVLIERQALMVTQPVVVEQPVLVHHVYEQPALYQEIYEFPVHYNSSHYIPLPAAECRAGMITMLPHDHESEFDQHATSPAYFHGRDLMRVRCGPARSRHSAPLSQQQQSSANSRDTRSYAPVRAPGHLLRAQRVGCDQSRDEDERACGTGSLLYHELGQLSLHEAWHHERERNDEDYYGWRMPQCCHSSSEMNKGRSGTRSSTNRNQYSGVQYDEKAREERRRHVDTWFDELMASYEERMVLGGTNRCHDQHNSRRTDSTSTRLGKKSAQPKLTDRGSVRAGNFSGLSDAALAALAAVAGLAAGIDDDGSAVDDSSSSSED